MENLAMRRSVSAGSWVMHGADRATLHGSTYFALALIALAIGLTVAAALFPGFFAGNLSQIGPGMP
jgi:hypothetical protein